MVESGRGPRTLPRGDATHEVEARREGGRAVLRCRACGGLGEVREGEFDRLNQFVDQHRPCASLAGAPGPSS